MQGVDNFDTLTTARRSPSRTDKRSHDAGQAEQGEDRKSNEREDHGVFTPPGLDGRCSNI